MRPLIVFCSYLLLSRGVVLSQSSVESLEEARYLSLAIKNELLQSPERSCYGSALQDMEMSCASLDDQKRKHLEVRLLRCMLQEAGRELSPCEPPSPTCIGGYSVGDDFTLTVLMTVKTHAVRLCMYHALIASQQRTELSVALLQSASLNATRTLVALGDSLSHLHALHTSLSSRILEQLAFFDQAERRQKQLEAMQAEMLGNVEAVAVYVQKTHSLAMSLLGARATWLDVAIYLLLTVLTVFLFSGFRRVGVLSLLGLSIALDRVAPVLLGPYLTILERPGDLTALLVLRAPAFLVKAPLLPPFLRLLASSVVLQVPLRDATRAAVAVLAVTLLLCSRGQGRRRGDEGMPRNAHAFTQPLVLDPEWVKQATTLSPKDSNVNMMYFVQNPSSGSPGRGGDAGGSHGQAIVLTPFQHSSLPVNNVFARTPRSAGPQAAAGAKQAGGAMPAIMVPGGSAGGGGGKSRGTGAAAVARRADQEESSGPSEEPSLAAGLGKGRARTRRGDQSEEEALGRVVGGRVEKRRGRKQAAKRLDGSVVQEEAQKQVLSPVRESDEEEGEEGSSTASDTSSSSSLPMETDAPEKSTRKRKPEGVRGGTEKKARR